MHGIILAGGNGSRLSPITKVISKQLLPIYDKPMIYYPLSLLMASGIRHFSIVTTKRDLSAFKNLLFDGSQWGIEIKYTIQEKPNGLPEAFLLCADEIIGKNVTLILGDNLFYGSQMGKRIRESFPISGARIYGYQVDDVSPYGALIYNSQKNLIDVIEKPKNMKNGIAIPGLYHFDKSVSDRTKSLKPSQRGELEIIDLIKSYLHDKELDVTILDRGSAWLDTGTMNDLAIATDFIRTLQTRQGLLIGSPEEVSYRNLWITSEQFEGLALSNASSTYGQKLLKILGE